MEDNNDSKKPITGVAGSGKKVNPKDKQQIQELILKLVEEKAQESRFSDRHFDRENQKHQLLNGTEFSIKEVKDFILSKAQSYPPMFPVMGYYTEMCRLYGWPESYAKVYFKKREAAVFTKEVIYGRFDKGVLFSLEYVLNPFVGYIKREFKHYQFLSPEGIGKLTIVISEATEMMKTCSTMYEFRVKWFNAYGVPYQVDIFGGSKLF